MDNIRIRDDRLKFLEDKLNDLQAEHCGCVAKIQELELRLSQAEATKTAEIAKIKREQSEADIVFAAVKLIYDVLGGSGTKVDHQRALQQLLQQRNPMLGMQIGASGGELLAGIGALMQNRNPMF